MSLLLALNFWREVIFQFLRSLCTSHHHISSRAHWTRYFVMHSVKTIYIPLASPDTFSHCREITFSRNSNSPLVYLSPTKEKLAYKDDHNLVHCIWCHTLYDIRSNWSLQCRVLWYANQMGVAGDFTCPKGKAGHFESTADKMENDEMRIQSKEILSNS